MRGFPPAWALQPPRAAAAAAATVAARPERQSTSPLGEGAEGRIRQAGASQEEARPESQSCPQETAEPGRAGRATGGASVTLLGCRLSQRRPPPAPQRGRGPATACSRVGRGAGLGWAMGGGTEPVSCLLPPGLEKRENGGRGGERALPCVMSLFRSLPLPVSLSRLGKKNLDELLPRRSRPLSRKVRQLLARRIGNNPLIWVSAATVGIAPAHHRGSTLARKLL